MAVHNSDIVRYHELICRVMEEQMLSQSSNHHKYKQADLGRLKIFLSNMRFELDNMQGEGNEYDYPKTDPRPYDLMADPDIILVENDKVNHVVRLLDRAKDEIKACPSALDSGGLQDDDHGRGMSYIQRIEDFIKNVIEVNNPLPFLESTPRRPIQGPGKGHVA